MAPVVSLPLAGLAGLAELQPAGRKQRWADVVDTGTPSPWTDYLCPDFKQAWPATPTPSHDTCAVVVPSKELGSVDAQTCPVLLEKPDDRTVATVCLPLHSTDGGLTMPGMMPLGMTMPSTEGHYAVLTQMCPVPCEIALPVSADAMAMPMHQQFAGYEVDPTLHNVNESVVVQQPQAWHCEFNVEMDQGYAMAMQWPSFEIPQQRVTPEIVPSSSPWPLKPEEGALCFVTSAAPPAVDLQQPPSPPSRQDEAKFTASQKELQHAAGNCRPCAWFWRPQGCQNGDACGYCHFCPEGELKLRKKKKIEAMRTGAIAPVKKSDSETAGGWGLKLDSLIQEA